MTIACSCLIRFVVSLPVLFVLCFHAYPAVAESLTSEELAEGWISLFDGETLYGWKHACEANFHVKNGTIAVSEGEVGILRTTTQYSEYRLKVDFRSEALTNSGIFLRTSPQPKDVVRDCFELNIANPENPFPTGSLVGRTKVTPKVQPGEWHSYDITLRGHHITIVLDGQTVLDEEYAETPGRGFIGLQHNQGKVEFRNIRLKPLGTVSLFNGRDLTGWNIYPNMESKFQVNKGHLNVTNGPGQLETEDRWGDFVLQLECICHGEHLNSGIFFRCIPGDRMMGYESQIHNGFEDNDRSRPVDFGTGGIFRRKMARRVVANDRMWFHKTIIAEGPHMAVWVNGYQVVDWTDKRKPNENPRRGLCLDPGTIMIQGHDPTTNISFRNLRAVELLSRRVNR